MGSLRGCRAIAFDLFGTVLDLGGSLRPALEAFLRGRGGVDAAAFWQQLRYRQRIEQYQDSLMLLGHGGLVCARKRTTWVRRDIVARMSVMSVMSVATHQVCSPRVPSRTVPARP